MPILATAYLIVLVAMALMDGCWLGLIAKGFYQRSIGHLMADQVNVAAAIAFYLLYAAGLTVMAVRPALVSGDWRDAALQGGLLGLFAYLTYDLSNLATLKLVPVTFAIVDILWGGILSAFATGIAVAIASRLFR
ncbi:MAG TPA: DUF2177 family protein [Aliidongia sp.]|uniref:DUF2177 family protein n=1 Tax=Aliidongia sp. TaxID=1914230 RepID=UPI002DDD7A00|nr:DUF2177 family protein [Aliidongia sp.]HEV2675603.1 DUF2177 family protein [Aliidongia sp.]